MKKKLKLIVCLCLPVILLSGCAPKVVTVADIYSQDQEEHDYIEIKELELKEKDVQKDQGSAARYCVVTIPAGYVESEDLPGMYIHEQHPLDSSNVYYSAFDSEGQEIFDTELTADSYKKAIESAYEKSGKGKLGITVNSFERQEVEGIPSYVIRTSFGEGETKIEQLIYLIMADKTYTITYSQAADDELLADFEVSEGKIKLVLDKGKRT